ncbi:MAG: hypothetical protein LBG58_02495 [Planctomycetaceae bacterium]|jgi:hypothetical protein|nr:hypothetical protein [Planctomycetaceae bacterium]
MVMIIEKYCRFLFGIGFVFAFFSVTAYSQTFSSFYMGQAASYPYPELPVSRITEKQSLSRHPESGTMLSDVTFYDYNYYYYNHREQNNGNGNENKSKNGTKHPPAVQIAKPAVKSASNVTEVTESNVSESNDTVKPEKSITEPPKNSSRYSPVQSQNNFWNRELPQHWRLPTVPNMIGDNTSIPSRVLSYHFWTTEKVAVPNPNYNPTPEFYNYGIDNIDYSSSSLRQLKYDNHQYIDIDESVLRTEVIPTPVTPSMFITSLNVAENFNAEVTDRFYADLRIFDGAQSYGISGSRNPIAVTKADVSRLTFGFEKRMGHRHSVELRLPVVLVGLKSSQHLVGTTKPEQDTELGNLSLIYKNVMYRNPQVTFCWGIGLNIPTAPDVQLNYVPDFGRDSIRGTIENRKTSFVPYVGLQWERNRTFGHLLGQIDVALGKNHWQFTDNRYGLTNYEMKISESSLFRFNVGMGRWFYNYSSDPSLFRVGGMVEAHFTSNLNRLNSKTIYSNTKSSSSYFSATATRPSWTTINLVGGLPIQTRKASLLLFIAVPITDRRYFDCEGGISADLKF